MLKQKYVVYFHSQVEIYDDCSIQFLLLLLPFFPFSFPLYPPPQDSTTVLQ